jgi:hypothetical protein
MAKAATGPAWEPVKVLPRHSGLILLEDAWGLQWKPRRLARPGLESEPGRSPPENWNGLGKLTKILPWDNLSGSCRCPGPGAALS